MSDEHGQLILVNPAGEQILGPVDQARDARDWARVLGFFLPDQATPYPVTELPLALAGPGQSCDAAEVFMRNPAYPEGRGLRVTALHSPPQDGQGPFQRTARGGASHPLQKYSGIPGT